MSPTSFHRLAPRRVLLSVLMAAATLPLVSAPAAAHATGATCMGLAVTIAEGTPGADTINGTSGDDVIQGLGGDDVIRGRGGNDVICGGGGNDNIFGEGGDDILIGGKGDDWLKGGDGADFLRGNAGNDRLYGNAGPDIARGWIGSDACGAEQKNSCEMKKKFGHDVEEWRDLVEEHFGPVGDAIGVPGLADEAIEVMQCESKGEPFAKNPRSSASGLFQFLSATWSSVSFKNGETETVFHPEANISNAAWLVNYSVNKGKFRWSQWAEACWPS